MRFTKGINQDVDPSAQPEGTYRDLINGILNDKTGSIVKDRPTQTEVNLVDTIAGTLTVPERDVIYVFGEGNGISNITEYDYVANSSSIILSDTLNITNGSLDFGDPSINHLDASYSINNNDELILYWTDGINPPRFYNVDKGKSIDNVYALNIFPYYNGDQSNNISFTHEVKTSGGSLSGGSYQIALAYIDDDGLLTNYFYVSHPIRIKREEDAFIGTRYFGLSDDEQSGNSISFEVSNLDTNYDKLRISAVKGTKVGNVQDIEIPDTGNVNYIYTGNEDETAGSIDEISIDSPAYERVNTLQQHNSQMYMGGVEKAELSKSEKESLQKTALNTKVYIDTKLGDAADLQSGGYTQSGLSPGFKRGEVYALYLSFIRKDGRETEAFHLPGRAPTNSLPSGNTDKGGQFTIAETTFNQRYQAIAEPDGTYGMGYWENENESYPDKPPFNNTNTTDLDNNGKSVTKKFSEVNVRHHRIPGPTYLEGKSDKRPTKIDGADRRANVAYLKIKDGSTDGVSIPSSLFNKIVGYKLYYAKKEDGDKLILDTGTFNAGFIDKEIDQNLFFNDNFSSASIEPTDFTDGAGGTDDVEVDIFGNGSTIIGPITLGDSDSDSTLASKLQSGIDSNSSVNAVIDDNDPVTNTNDSTKVNVYYDWVDANDDYPNRYVGNSPSITTLDNNNSGGDSVSYSSSQYTKATSPNGWRPYQNADKEGNDNYRTSFKDFKYCTFGFDENHEWEKNNGDDRMQQWGSDQYTAYGRPAYSMINRPDLSAVTHLRGIEKIEYDHGPNLSQYNLHNADGNRTKIKSPKETGGSPDKNWFVGINAGPAYVENNKREVNLVENYGFRANMDNLFGESKIVLEIKPVSGGGWTGEMTRGYRTIFDMCVRKTDVHVSYDRQQLVDTGSIGSVDSNGEGTNQVFSNGDTFITKNTYKANTVLSLLNGDGDGNKSDDPWKTAFEEWWLADIVDELNIEGVSTGSDKLKGTRLGIQEEIGTKGNINVTPFPVSHSYDTYIESRIPCGLVADGEHPRYDLRAPRDGGSSPWRTVPDAEDLEPSINEYDTSNNEAENILISRQWANYFIRSDNYPEWNEEYADLNTLKTAFPWDPSDFPDKINYNRVIRSAGEDESGRSRSFRRFREEDKLDIREDRGEILNLTQINNNLLIHLERSLIQTRGRERLKTTGGQKAFIGGGDIFAVPQDELNVTELGFAGLESFRAQTKCEAGYFFVDKGANSIYWLSQSQGLNELTTEQFGLSEFFDKRLRSDKEPRVGYDPDSGRVMFTFFDTNNSNHDTLSFYPTRGSWGSRHSYHPDRYVDILDTLATIKESNLYFHEEGSSNSIYGLNRIFRFSYAVPHGFNHKLDHVWVNADNIDSTGSITRDRPFDLLEAKNSHQTTGNITLTNYEDGSPSDITQRGNVRKTQGVWRVHDLRESGLTGPSSLPDWARKAKLEDDHHIITIEKIASDESIILRAAGAQSEQTIH